MTSLDLDGGGRPKVELQAGFRSGPFHALRVVSYGAGGTAIALGAYEVFRSQPDKSFQLLQVWGPAFLIAIFGIYIYGQISESQIKATRESNESQIAATRESFGELAASVRSAVEASMRQADAMNRMAEANGETARETQRLAMFAAQQGQEITERLDRQDEVLSELARGMKGLHSMLSKEKAALDEKEKEAGGTGR